MTDDYTVKDPNACRKLVEIINQALPDTDTTWLDLDDILVIDGSPHVVWYLNIHVCVSVAGVLKLYRYRTYEDEYKDTDEWSESLNGGEPLVAGAGYLFSVEVSGRDMINLLYSATGGTISKLRISEVI